MIGKAEVARMADWAVGANLDLLLLDGDFADGRPDLVGDLIEPLAQLGSAGTAAADGVWFVTGNHEYLHGGSGPAWMEWWSARGVNVLYNNRTSLPGAFGRSFRPFFGRFVTSGHFGVKFWLR